jgi:superfamily II DNA or RNA helicase
LAAYVNVVETICYKSLDTVKGKTYDLVVLDEGHNITTANSVFFSNNVVKDIMVLTATRPTSFEKVAILNALGVKPTYEINLDEAVKLGIVAPYNVTVITMPIDEERRYIKKWKKSEALFTEKDMLNYHNMAVFSAKNPRARLNRMQFIYKLESKTIASKRLLGILREDLRSIIFCANKAQATELCENRYFTKPTINKKDVLDIDKLAEYRKVLDNWQGNTSLNKFLLEEISRISCVNALNEGHNLGMIDIAFIAQLNSKQLHFIQRIGRILRWSIEHRGEIIVLVARGTIDEEWARRATRGLDVNNIRWLKIEDVLEGNSSLLRETGIETTNFTYEQQGTAANI